MVDVSRPLDQLFVLKPGFADGPDGPFFCPESAMVEGLLSYHPRLRAQIDVHYVDFPRPRLPIVALLGESVQGCPVLVLGDPAAAVPAGLPVGTALGRRFVKGALDVCTYLASAHGSSLPHP